MNERQRKATENLLGSDSVKVIKVARQVGLGGLATKVAGLVSVIEATGVPKAEAWRRAVRISKV